MPEVQNIDFKDPATQAASAVEELQDMQGEKMVLNMGPSHPATHGVLRIVLELDGPAPGAAVLHVFRHQHPHLPLPGREKGAPILPPPAVPARPLCRVCLDPGRAGATADAVSS